MKYYAYDSDEGTKVYSEQDILKEYFPYWSEQMRKVNKESEISRENCITDWIVVNWAYEVPVKEIK